MDCRLGWSEQENAAYRRGADDALKFRADPYRDLFQDVFKAETAEYRLSVSYNDPEGLSYLRVEFKGRRTIKIEYPSAGEAIKRAIIFVSEHPAPQPSCEVDY